MSFSDRLAGVFNKKSNVLFKASEALFHTDFLPTGIAALDASLGGGFGRGRIHELFGNYSSGKTLALYYALIKNTQMGGESVLFESEGAFDKTFYRALGGDPATLSLIPIDHVEEFFNGVVAICKAQEAEIKEAKKNRTEEMKKLTVIGWDSIAATGTKHLQETGMDKRDMSKSGMMSQGTQLITTLVKECNATVIACNQTREAIGSKDSATHTPGGSAWSFHCSQRVELRYDGGTKGSLIFERPAPGQSAETTYGRDEIGRWIAGYVVKNKLASPFARFKIPIYTLAGYEHPEFDGKLTKLGIDTEEMLLNYFLEGRCYINDLHERVVHIPSSGWYCLHPSLDPEQQKFRMSKWPEILQDCPLLTRLPYDLCSKAVNNTPSVPPEVPGV